MRGTVKVAKDEKAPRLHKWMTTEPVQIDIHIPCTCMYVHKLKSALEDRAFLVPEIFVQPK